MRGIDALKALQYYATMYSTVITIPETDIDPTYRHLHHASIVKVFEAARLRWLDAVGCPNDKLLAQGLFFVLTSIKVEFKREVRAGDYEVTCDELVVVGKEVRIPQRLLNPKGKVAATAEVGSCFLAGGRSIVPPQVFLDALKRADLSVFGGGEA